ncbi:MAG: enoyl-ACP reductase FabI [Alphaproteobacteria bacterium]|jgi:enoyl-[acyl-carrier protein] reductase I|nr:enoyl-ACP reductase FabI [Alphaproteobacteria bacterium]
MGEGLPLSGRKGLVVGIANNSSVAWGCAQAYRELGAELAITYLNAKAEKHVRPLGEELGAPIILPMDVQRPGEMEAVFDTIRERWGRLDFLLHSIAYAPMEDLHGRVTDCSLSGFQLAMDVSCHSFIRMARLAEPLMVNGGCLVTMTYIGSTRVVPNYNMMGPVKAALESVVRYLAAELGSKGIRVHAVSPGPIKTRAASGIAEFDHLMKDVESRAPVHDQVSIEDVGMATANLAVDDAKLITGNVVFVDAGFNIMA